jgi:tRNA(Ile)-lysidine synthase
MTSRRDEEAKVLDAVRNSFAGLSRIVVAVSGGLDSMVLLDAASRAWTGPGSSLLVATFDHRTGAHASRAATLVQSRARSLKLSCVVGVASARAAKEHEWREQRWQFLHNTAENFHAPVVTAHTLDDQVETVFMRILRDAGARGLAGLYAESDVLRPFLELRRSDLENYATLQSLRHVEDPSNLSRAFLRNRVRHDLLPAIMKERPTFSTSLLTIARMAAKWREEMEKTVAQIDVTPGADGSLRVARKDLAGYDAESLRTLWPAIASKVGVVMDRRGTHRLAEFTMKGHTGSSIQLSGGVEVRMFRDHFVLGKWDVASVEILRRSRMPLAQFHRDSHQHLA